MADDDARIEVRREGHLMIITMVRATKRNAIDRRMADALDEARASLVAEHPGYDVLFFLGDGPQIKPRLIPSAQDAPS